MCQRGEWKMPDDYWRCVFICSARPCFVLWPRLSILVLVSFILFSHSVCIRRVASFRLSEILKSWEQEQERQWDLWLCYLLVNGLISHTFSCESLWEVCWCCICSVEFMSDPPLSEMFYNCLEISCGMTMVKIFVSLRTATNTETCWEDFGVWKTN